MSDGFDSLATGGLNRRAFLSVGALPLVAAAGATEFDSERATRRRSVQSTIRVGIIGAGANVRNVMLPALRRIAGCEIVAVANRSLESSQRVADEFDIPRAYAHWGELLDDETVDAVLIGTWPYMHHAMTLAALDKGKHVLCQARMANTAAEAREMLAASLRNPHLVSQLVPATATLTADRVVKRLIGEGYVGEVLSVEIQVVQGDFPDFGGELEWRQDRQLSGYNTLRLGATYEAMMRWLGRGNRVMAMSKVHVPFRRDASGELTSVTIPDHLDVLYELANGAQVHMRFSETTGLSNGNHTWIHGTEGTIHVQDFRSRQQRVFAGRRGDSELSEVPNPPEQQARYRAEEEFINAIRGIEVVTMVPFETGVHYMEWTEAVYRSSQTGEAVYLPL